MNLKSKNLCIREFTLADISTIYMLSQEEGIKKWLPDQVYKDENEAKDVLIFLIAQYGANADPKKQPLVFAIEKRDTHELIGHVGLSPVDQGVEIGYAIGSAYTQKGYATEVVSLFSSWAIKSFKLNKIFGIAATANKPSIRVLEKSAYQLLGEEDRLYHGEKYFVSIYQYSQEFIATDLLKSERIEMRPLAIDDAPALFAYRSKDNIAQFQGWQPGTIEDAETFICEKISAIPNLPGTWFQLGVFKRSEQILIGDCGIYFKENIPEVMIGYTIAPEYQRKGFGSELVRMLVNYIFSELDIRRITASVDARNRASLLLLEKVGFRKEAHFKESYWFKGEWTDDVIYAMLKSEWQENIRNLRGSNK